MRIGRSRLHLTCSLLGAMLAGAATAAPADELQFDLTGTAYTSTGASAGLFDVSFMLDTTSGFISTGFYDPNLPDNPYQNAFIVTAASYSNVNFVVNGVSLLSATQAEGSYILATAAVAHGNTELPDNHTPSFEWEFAPMPAYMSEATYNSLSDPLAAVFLSYQNNFQGTGTLTLNVDGTDSLSLVFASETVTDLTPPPVVGVPEPGVLELMLLGFAGVCVLSRRSHARPAKVRVRG